MGAGCRLSSSSSGAPAGHQLLVTTAVARTQRRIEEEERAFALAIGPNLAIMFCRTRRFNHRRAWLLLRTLPGALTTSTRLVALTLSSLHFL